MNITRENLDDLNAVVKVAISKEDYGDKVKTVLDNYRKNASIPGFRKGRVPMGLVKKQYGQAVLVEEVNKLLQESLGGPIPCRQGSDLLHIRGHNALFFCNTAHLQQ